MDKKLKKLDEERLVQIGMMAEAGDESGGIFLRNFEPDNSDPGDFLLLVFHRPGKTRHKNGRGSSRKACIPVLVHETV